MSLFATVATASLLAACGGGGSLDDGQTPLRTDAKEVTLTSPTATCPPAPGGVIVYVFGGVAPYSLRNPLPEQVVLDKQSVANAGEGVRVTFAGGCLQSIPLTFVDKIGSTVSVSLTYLATPDPI